jgi:ABC-type branched-subunit amino acid transport system ATPase component/ABC-type branched-subunit amino acid transport system permease subunit
MRHDSILALILVVAAGLAPALTNSYQLSFLLQLLLMVALAQSWNLISGIAGYVSFGHAVFFGVGAYTGALLLLAGYTWWLGVLWAALMATAVALPVGLLTLRLRGPYFAIAMLGLNEVGRVVATLWVSLTKGGDGIALTPSLLPTLETSYFAMLFLAMLATLMIGTVLRSRFGLELRAIREDEAAAEMVGVNTTRDKIIAFAASAVIPGAAGAVYAYYTSFIDPTSVFLPALNIQMVVMVLLGGRGSLWGPVIGALIIMSVREVTWAEFPALHLAMLGILMILVTLYLPDGILSLLRARRGRRRDRVTEECRGQAKEGIRAMVARAVVEGPILETRNLHRHFGGLQALSGVDLQVRQGGITGLIGPNGSGKTTLFQVVSGMDRGGSGEVRFNGRQILGLRPSKIYRLSLARTFQLSRVFPGLTVLENLLVAGRPGDPETRKRALGLIERVNLCEHVEVPGSELSYGQQKLVEFLRVLMGHPTLILLDEPAAGVNPTLRHTLWELVRHVNELGTSVLIIEHNMNVIADLCGEVYVLNEGQIIARGKFDAIRDDPRVLEAYFGHNRQIVVEAP